MTTGLPFDDIRALIASLPGPDDAARHAAHNRNAVLSAQGVMLGRMADLSEWVAAWSGRAPRIARPMVALFAGTHGVSRHLGPDAPGAGATQDMVAHCAAGGAAINQICGAHEVGLKVFDLALDMPVTDITEGPALDERDCAATMAFGMEAVAGGIDLICLGTIAGAGETSAAAIMLALYGGAARDWASAGEPEAAANGRRVELVERAVAAHAGKLGDPLEILRRLGGREFAAIAGAILAARSERMPVILDGYVTTSVAAILKAIRADAVDHCLLGHVTRHDAHRRAAEAADLPPLLDLGLGEGEGLGAAMAAGIVRDAVRLHTGMAFLDGKA